jgi:hypothetical protein
MAGTDLPRRKAWDWDWDWEWEWEWEWEWAPAICGAVSWECRTEPVAVPDMTKAAFYINASMTNP